MTDPTLPPIMQTPGLRLVAIGQTSEGKPYLKFITNRKRVVEIVVVITEDPTVLVYGYTLFDEQTSTTQHYRGIYGDPAKDSPDPEGLWATPT